MKTICLFLGLALIAVAAAYFLVPAEALPPFFPGHEAGVTRVHTKHGLVAAAAGVVLIAIGWFIGRR